MIFQLHLLPGLVLGPYCQDIIMAKSVWSSTDLFPFVFVAKSPPLLLPLPVRPREAEADDELLATFG